MRIASILALALLTSPAFAGSQSRDCETADKSIVMGAGNSTNSVTIQFTDKDGKRGSYEAPVKIMPQYDYNTVENEKTISAIPASPEKVLSRKHQQMHVIHKDGTECWGREQWDDRSVQTYVLVGKDNKTLFTYDSGLYEKKVKGATSDGYIVAEFRCHEYGVTSPGGCFANEGDKIIWEDEK